MEAEDRYLPQQVIDENLAVNSFMEQMVKEIERIQAEREAAYQKAMQPLPEDNDK
jgi:hypothetical protein